MILTFILNMASNFVVGFSHLTSGIATLPSSVTDAITYALTSAQILNYLIPVPSLLIALGVVIAYEAAIWTFKAAVWIYRHIPFIGH